MQVHAVLRRQAVQHGLHGLQMALRPHRDGALIERQLTVRRHQFGVEFHVDAQSVARRAGALRAVEGKQARFELRATDAAVGAGMRDAAQQVVTVNNLHPHQAVAVRQGGFNRVGQAGGNVGPHHKPVDDDLDGVIEIAVQRRHRFERHHLAVNAHPHEAVPLDLLQFLAVRPFAMTHHRRQDEQPVSLGKLQHAIHDVLHRLRPDRLAALRTMRHANPREQQAQVVVNLRHRADRRARVAAHRLLLDGNGGRQPLDGVHVGLFELFQKLAGVGRQGFNVAPLPFGVEGVEGEGRLAGAAQPGDDHQAFAGDVNCEVFEIVLAGATNGDHVAHSCTSMEGVMKG